VGKDQRGLPLWLATPQTKPTLTFEKPPTPPLLGADRAKYLQNCRSPLQITCGIAPYPAFTKPPPSLLLENVKSLSGSVIPFPERMVHNLSMSNVASDHLWDQIQ